MAFDSSKKNVIKITLVTGGDFWQKHIFIPFLKKKTYQEPGQPGFHLTG